MLLPILIQTTLAVVMLPKPVLLDDASKVLLGVQLGIPALLLATLFCVALTNVLYVYGRKMSGTGSMDIGEEDDEDVLASVAVKGSKDKKKKKTKKKKPEDDKPKFRPKRLYLLAPLLLIAFTYLAEGAAVLIESFALKRKGISQVDFAVAFLSLLAYWIACFMFIVSRDLNTTLRDHFKAFTVVSVLGHPAILICLIILSTSRKISTESFPERSLFVLSVILAAIRSVAGLALPLAYLKTFSEEIPDQEEEEVIVDTIIPDADPATGEGGKKKKEEEEEDDDDDDEDEKPKARAYDIFAIYNRISRLLPYLAPIQSRSVKFVIVVCILLSLISTSVQVLIPRQTGIIADQLAKGEDPSVAILVWIGISLVVGWSGVLSVVRSALWRPIGQLASRQMDVMAFNHVLSLSARFHNNKKTGELISVLNRAGDSADFMEFAMFSMAPLILDVATASTYLTVVYGWQLTLTIATTGFAYMLVQLYTKAAMIWFRSRMNELRDQVASNKNEAISSIDVVKYFGQETYEANRFNTGLCRNQLASYKQSTFMRLTYFAQELTTQAGVLVGAFLVAGQIMRGEKEVGAFVAFSAYMMQILSKFGSMVWYGDYFSRLMTNTDKLVDVLDEKPEIHDDEDAEELLECRGEIEFSNVTFMYEDPKVLKKKREDKALADGLNNGHVTNGSEDSTEDASKKPKKKKEPRKAVQNLSFTIKPGQHVAFVGETGAGKSTIFKLLFRFFDVSEGSIKVDGKDIREYTQRSLRQSLGVVQQEASLFNDTILANIQYGDITASMERIVEVAKAAKIHDRIMQWPKKYQTKVGDRGVKLSGGEKQRVSIARTLLKNPDVLLLDEATAALDTATEKDIQGQLRKMTEGKTTLAIAHRLSTIAYADKIVVLNEGKIVETGTHNELIKIKNGVYKKLWETQISAGKTVDEETSAMAHGKTEILVDTSIPDDGQGAKQDKGKEDPKNEGADDAKAVDGETAAQVDGDRGGQEADTGKKEGK